MFLMVLKEGRGGFCFKQGNFSDSSEAPSTEEDCWSGAIEFSLATQ